MSIQSKTKILPSRTELRSKHAQKGALTLFSFVFLLMAGVILTLVFKLYPAFYQHWKVEKVVTSFQRDSDLIESSLNEVERKFKARLQTNNVRNFNFEEAVVIEKDDEVLLIDVDYEVRVNLYRNIDAVMSFQKSFETRF